MTSSQNSISIDELIEAISSVTTLAEMVGVLADSFAVEEGFSVSYESSNSIDDSFSIEGDVSASFMVSLLLQDAISIEDDTTVLATLSITLDNGATLSASMTTDSSNTWLLDESFAVCNVNLDDLKKDLNNIMDMLLADESDVALFMLLKTIDVTR